MNIRPDFSGACCATKWPQATRAGKQPACSSPVRSRRRAVKGNLKGRPEDPPDRADRCLPGALPGRCNHRRCQRSKDQPAGVLGADVQEAASMHPAAHCFKAAFASGNSALRIAKRVFISPTAQFARREAGFP